MNTFRNWSLLCTLMLPTSLIAQSFDGAPDSLSLQGVLADSGGVPVQDGNYNIVFTLYDAAVGGSSVWTETYNGSNAISTTNGVFDVILGELVSLADVAFDKPLFVGLSVNGDPEMAPRTPLVSAPFALSLRNMRVTPETDSTGPNLIGGWSKNSIGDGVVGATIAGGGGAPLGTPAPNQVTRSYGTVGGGRLNTASGNTSTIAGGSGNEASGQGSVIGGGAGNSAVGGSSTIAGGVENSVTLGLGTIGGGDRNTASGFGATVGGGERNTASAGNATVSGGSDNTASVIGATVPGGFDNRAAGVASFAAGWHARSIHNGTFVWNDRSVVGGNDSLLSTGVNQFIIRAEGGVGMGTNAPLNNSQLHVEHDSVGTNDWGVVISSTKSSFRAGMRINNQGFFDVTNNANASGPSLARLNSTGVWTAISDRRVKTDIEPADGMLESALALEPVRFRFRQTPAGEVQLGMIAQQVRDVEPSLVTEGERLTLNYSGLSVIALGAIQEQHRVIEAQAEQLTAQERRVTELRLVLQEQARLLEEQTARLVELERVLQTSNHRIVEG